MPGCLKVVATVGVSIEQSASIVMGYLLVVKVPHAVEVLLTKTRTQYLTNMHHTHYEQTILAAENSMLERCLTLNPAKLMSLTSDDYDMEGEHDCLEVTELCTKLRSDIIDVPLAEPDRILFVDSSCLSNDQGTLRAAYAVCTLEGVVKVSSLCNLSSAQVAELISLTRACCASQEVRVTMYTDSQHGFGVVH